MMELKDFVSTTIKQIAEGINEAIKANNDYGMIVNPDVTIGSNGDYVIPTKGTYGFKRRIQNIEMEISLILEDVATMDAGVKLMPAIFGANINGNNVESSNHQHKVRFSVPIALPATEVDIPQAKNVKEDDKSVVSPFSKSIQDEQEEV
ncbi:MAG: hypothetical protein E7091_10980 [Bacteroidales bacterium]|nr:hypothetical protein [Bacteroidales bacterium]